MISKFLLHIPKPVKTIIREFLKITGLLYVFGRAFLKHACPNKEKHYIFIYQGIGDIIIARGYIDEYIKRNGIAPEKVCFVLLNRNKQVYDMYSDNYDRRIIGELTYRFLGAFFFSDRGYKTIHEKENLTLIYTGVNMKTCWNYMYNMPGMNFMYFVKYGILNLDDSAEFLYPRIEVKDKSHIESYQLKADSFVVLNPYANSLYNELSDTFWEELAKGLQEKGLRVFTDCGKGDKPVINGTEHMATTMSEMYEISKECKAYIGIRSGMLDLLSLNGCNIVALYPKTEKYKDEYFQAFDINALNRLLGRPEINRQFKANDEQETLRVVLDLF
ncbi:MAG: hypothetical protein K6F26_02035 [Lachnospiraceae bacterium]|nr:hypothetical protein [Lachnospiraceae bacterium]